MKIIKTSALFVFAALLVASCSSKPEGTEAQVSEAQEVKKVSNEASTYGLALDQSEVEWYGFKPTGSHNGTFAIKNGDISVENGEIVGGEFTIDLAQIEVSDLEGEYETKLVTHLKSPDFFDVENHPEAKFVITSVEAYDENTSADFGVSGKDVVVNDEEVNEFTLDSPTHIITGNLTMRGNSLSISFPAKVSMENDAINAEAKFMIDRTKWGVSYREEATLAQRAKDELIYDTVHIEFEINASSKDEPVS